MKTYENIDNLVPPVIYSDPTQQYIEPIEPVEQSEETDAVKGQHPFTRADERAQKKLGPMPSRPKTWVAEYFWRGFEIAVSNGTFSDPCDVQETCVNTLRSYFVATLQDSNRQGKDVWTGVKKIAERMGRSSRTVYRVRAVARETGFEEGARRCWKNPETNAYCSASARLRFLVPEHLADAIAGLKKIAAAKRRLAPVAKSPFPTTKKKRSKLSSEPARPKIEEFVQEPKSAPTAAEKKAVKGIFFGMRQQLRPG